MSGKLASSTRNHGNNVGTIENKKNKFQPLKNDIKHCLQSRLFASTYFFINVQSVT